MFSQISTYFPNNKYGSFPNGLTIKGFLTEFNCKNLEPCLHTDFQNLFKYVLRCDQLPCVCDVGYVGRKKGETMEQNVRTLSVIFATLALIASVLVMPNVSATDGDLQTEISGDDGLESYASAAGHASFSAAISSASGDAHTNVVVSAAFAEGSGWTDTQAVISDCIGEGTAGSNNTGDLAAGETNDICIVVSVSESGSEAGDDAYMTVSVTSDEDSTGTSTEVRIVVSDWFVYSNDEAKVYDEGDTNSYTITLQNIKKEYNDATGEAESVALEDDVTIELSNAGEGWNIDSENSAWDKLNLEATISYIAADGSFDLVLDIQLVGGIIPASSYIGSNSNIVFTTFDDAGVYALVSLEATVQDNFALNSVGSGNEYVDNGCDSDDTATLGWSPSIQNFGNTLDSFTVTFDTSDAGAAGWAVDGHMVYIISNQVPQVFSFDAKENTFSIMAALYAAAFLSAFHAERCNSRGGAHTQAERRQRSRQNETAAYTVQRTPVPSIAVLVILTGLGSYAGWLEPPVQQDELVIGTSLGRVGTCET